MTWFRIFRGLLPALALALVLVAGTAAQDSGPVAEIMDVDSQSFPRVTASLFVVDENGPVDNLTVDDFKVFEAGAPLPSASIVVDSEAVEGLRLVLAIDVSIPDEKSFAQVKEAAKSLVGSLRPRDRAAVLSFASEVNLEYNLTNNTEALQAAIDDLTADISYTASYAALAEATTLLDEQPSGRKAVIMITDSQDNTGAGGIDQTISQAQASNISLYIIGFGQKTQGDPLISAVGSTGGQYFTLSGADQIQAGLQDIEALLRQGYKVTFLSGLEADNTEQELKIVVTARGKEAQAKSSFVTTPGEVTVTLKGVAPEQTVAQVVSLRAEVVAPAPSASVEYYLDDELLATVAEPPYAFDWDSSTAQSGPHTLRARVVDSAGNSGQAEMPVNVIQPVRVTILTTKKEFESGEQITIRARVETETELLKVELLLDGVVLDSLAESPYNFGFDSSDFPVGRHTITVRVEDTVGQTVENSIPVVILPPVFEPVWSKRLRGWLGVSRSTFQSWVASVKQALVIVAAETAIISALLLAIIFTIRIEASLRKRSQQKHQVQLVNFGNIHSHYRLKAEETAGALEFEFALNGVGLPRVATVPQGVSAGRVTPATPPPAAERPAVRPASSSPPPAARESNQMSYSSIQKPGAQAQGCLSAIDGILRTLGDLLPGSAARSVRGASHNISAGQSRVRQATVAPRRAASNVGQLQSQVGGLTSSTSTGTRQARTRTDTAILPTSSRISETPAARPPQPAAVATNTVVANGNQTAAAMWAETPTLEPGGILDIDLMVKPVHPFRKQTYSFTVHSGPAEREKENLVSEQGVVEIKGVSWIRRFLPVLVVLALTGYLIFEITYLAIWRLTGADIFNRLPFG